jgi:hypothetical protein
MNRFSTNTKIFSTSCTLLRKMRKALALPSTMSLTWGIAIGRAKGLDAASAHLAGRISLGLFFAETNGKQNMGNARSDKYKGGLQTGVSEDRKGQRKRAAMKESIAAFDPALAARDAREEERIGALDQRLNHWTAVRDGLMKRTRRPFPSNTCNSGSAAESD